MKKAILALLVILSASSMAFASKFVECKINGSDFLKATVQNDGFSSVVFSVEVIAPDLYSNKDGHSSGAMTTETSSSGGYYQLNVADRYNEFKYSINVPQTLIDSWQTQTLNSTLNWTIDNNVASWRTLNVACTSSNN